MRIHRLLSVLYIGTVALGAALNAPVIDAVFWKTWGDGNAELAGYQLIYPRYGQPRQGTAVTIFVSETFSNRLRVKADPGKHPASDEFPVMKLNLIEDFQTGIYDYNEMTSSFVALAPVNGRPAGSLTKVSFSGQEWCGNSFAEMLFDPDSIRLQTFSYFDGEADTASKLAYPKEVLEEDAFLLWARGMAAPALSPGQTREVAWLASLQDSRHKHRTLDWTRATISRSQFSSRVSVPGGTFEVETFAVKTAAGMGRTVYVEKAEPHRIVKWESTEGERAELLRATRLKYWQLNGLGKESMLKELGLSPRPRRTT